MPVLLCRPIIASHLLGEGMNVIQNHYNREIESTSIIPAIG